MLQTQLRIESMLFHYETTYQADYRHGEIREYPKTVFKPKPVKERTLAYRNVNNLHTMTEWKGDVPSFSLTHAPKEIVRTNPHVVMKPLEEKEDLEREIAQKTRPRLVVAPAVSMDDIADPTARSILCTDMYTSEMRRGMREAVAALPPQVKAPLPELPAPANPIALPKLQPPYVSPEWRMETVSWDNKQLRAHCDPTREFWLTRDPMKCRICDESALVAAHRKMKHILFLKMSAEKHFEDMLFNYETSYRTYHRNGEIKPIIKTVFKAKPSCYRIRPPPLKDIHTLVDWKDARVPPFTLLHKPKDIVQTNPRDVQQPYEKPIDVDLEHAKNTRPRVFITPALSLDDAPPEKRKLLVDEMYTTTARRSSALAATAPSVKAPLPASPAPANLFTLPKLVPPYVSPEWRIESAAWDARQLRACCDATREFHLARPLRCDACKFTAAREAQMKLQKQMKNS
ncbi:uncharacterized protein LOC123867378 [Maniola jurtina]|uniref:uncharacterized protein LOC123867378 n=1 Tax=Maniola jurtina TaxID=191418 RepID=UPI001E68F39C|nr:uncharacterized protein LOC123867378 [Maniola jurtina]